ncbi:MAG: apolipoprotein N-acyltransferase [Elusimicrobiales bacterium]|nr:apolipoprotein N-acyltransferase [Elusimicrobiales bacterium]MCK5582154.1 apolipoprotein N-acyltransferase [Elusimicrobiales bacterium]
MKNAIKTFFNFGFTLKEFLAVFLGSCLLVLSMPPYDFSVFAFFALIPLLIILENKSFSVSLRLGLIAGFISNAIALFWLYLLFDTFSIVLFCILAVFWGIFGVIFSAIQKLYNYKIALISAPFTWVAIEFLKSEQWKLKFGWLSLGYSQHNNEPVLMTAKYIGVYGVSALILCVSAAMILFFKFKDLKTRLIAAMGILLPVMLIICPILFKDKPITAGKMRFYGIQAEGNFNKCMELSLKAKIKPNSLVVFPEYSMPDSPLQNPSTEKKVLNFIEKINSYLIFGCIEFTDDEKMPFNNIALIYSPKGKFIGKFQKHHPIQFFADGKPGTGYPVFKIPSGILGVGICYDYDYVDVARNLANKGAMVLIAPTMDALSWSKTQHIQHASIMPFRAVETGRFLLRPASSGISMVINPQGQILTQLGFGKVGVIEHEIPLLEGKTFYVRYGYLFPYLSQIICILLLLAGIIRYRRKKN